jgi:hypothetical protein
LKSNQIDYPKSDKQNCFKNKPNMIKNKSMDYTKLGMTKSHNQIITTFEFSKMNLLYKIHNKIIFDDQTITESFRMYLKRIELI